MEKLSIFFVIPPYRISIKQVDEKLKRRNVHNIKQKHKDGVIDDVVWINGEKMIANGLTKDLANGGRLRLLLGSAIGDQTPLE